MPSFYIKEGVHKVTVYFVDNGGTVLNYIKYLIFCKIMY